MADSEQKSRYYWRPLSLYFLLNRFSITSSKVFPLILGWALLICTCIIISSIVLPAEWLTPGQMQAQNFFAVYPSYLVGLLLLFWLGFEWGFVPLFISAFTLAFNSGMDIILSAIFGIAFIFALALFGLAYQSLRLPHDLRDFKSVTFFISIAFIAALASSMCALIWSLAHELSAFETVQMWKSWWTGVFFQSVIFTGPLLFLFTPSVEKLKTRFYKVSDAERISLRWIYGTVVCITVTLLAFILSGQLLGKYRISEVINRMPDITRGDVFGALDSFEIIFWLSMGLIILTGFTAIYLVGQWNQHLRDEVREQTQKLEASKKKLQKSLEEKKLMLKETNHRVKNNLAQISALLQLQMKNVDDEKYSHLIQDATSRIHSMTLIHQALYDTEDYTNISLEEYLKNLCSIIHHSFQNDETDIRMKYFLSEYSVDTQQAVTLGLILTEILINAHKYAFIGRDEGTITVSLEGEDGKILMMIFDNGIGLPDSARTENAGLGLKLIQKLSRQLDAEISIKSNELGTRFSLLFERAN